MTWYVAITNPNCHRRAESGLASLGYQVFWPKLKKWVSHARTKVAKEYPILGRYIFVEIPDGRFGVVRNVDGIEGLVTNGSGAPASIPGEIVWAFRQRYMRGEWDFVNETGGLDADGQPRQNLIPIGAQVRIMEGQFADMLTVVRGRRNGKIKFLPAGAREFKFTRESNVRAA
jgi:transcription antitermination factor NusG